MMNRDHFLSVSGADYIRAMFANTKDGILTLGDEEYVEQIPLDWDEETMEEMVSVYEELVSDLTRLTQWERSMEGMPMNLLGAWLTFMKPYPEYPEDSDKLFSLSMKAELHEEMTPEEQQQLDAWHTWMEEQALTRMPYHHCNPANLIQRARRYEKLVALKAPKVVLDNESRCLAEELVQYYCLTVEE